MKSKRIILALLVLSAALLLTACSHTHTFAEDWSKDATHHWHAATCEHTTEVSDKAEHTWDAGVETKAPTEEVEGTKLYTCTECGATKEENIDKLAHTHKYSDEWSKDATHHWHASSCGHDSEISGKEEHAWDAGVVTLEPTEEAEGTKLHTCTVCSATKEESVEKLPHTHKYQDTWTSDDDYHWHGSACGHEEEVKDVAEHSWNEGEVTKAPTCQANGEKTHACTVCGKTKVEPISKDMNAHSYQEGWEHDETNHWHPAACGHDVVTGTAEHIWDEGVQTKAPTYYEEGVTTYTCECGRTRTESIPVLKNFESSEWTSLVEEGYYYLDGKVISNVSEDLSGWFNADQTNFNLYNTTTTKNYTINVDVQGVTNVEKHDTLLAGVVVWYQDANNYIVFGAHWSNSDRPHEVRSFWFKGLVDGQWFSSSDFWCDGCMTLPAEGLKISVTKKINVFTFSAINMTTNAVIKTGECTIPGTDLSSSKVGVYGVNEPFAFSNFATENIVAPPVVYTANVGGVQQTLSLSTEDDKAFTLVNGDTTVTGTYTENGRNKTLTYADGTVQSVRTHSKGKTFEYITLKTMEDPDMELTYEWTLVQKDVTGDYTISFDFLGSVAYEGVLVKAGLKAWYLDKNNYVDIYMEWGAADRPHELKCVQITGYLNGNHIGWFDIWADGSGYLPIDGGHLTITKEGQKFTATYSNDSGYKKTDSRVINIDTSATYKIYAYAEGDTVKVDNFSYKYTMPTSAVTYNAENGDKLVVDTTTNNCVLTVGGVEQAGYYTFDGAYGIVTVGEEQKHVKLVVDKSLFILYTPAEGEADPNAVTVTPEAAVTLAEYAVGDYVLTMDVKGLINANVTADRTNFNLYPWYLDANNYVIVKVEWWNNDRPYEIRSIIVEAYVNGAKVAGTERFGDWPSTYTLPADGFQLVITKAGNKFTAKLVSALTGVEKVTDQITATGLDTAAKYSVVAASVTDTFTVSNLAGLTIEKPLETISIAEALEIGNSYAKDAYSTEKYTIVGTVKEVQSTTYGNILLTDGTNEILVYGLYSADGSVRYDKMENKPGLGDVITVTGVLGKYSAAQMKNGWLLAIEEHVCSEYTEATCKVPASCVVCGEHRDEVLSDVHDYKDGVCTVCNGVDPDYEGDVVVLVDSKLDFSNKSNRTSFTTSQQVWEQNGVKLINDKGSSTSNVADYSNPARFYKSSKITIECSQMTKIVFNCNNASYATALKNSITSAAGGTVTVNGSAVTVTFETPVDSFVIASLTGGQVRVNNIVVTHQQ